MNFVAGSHLMPSFPLPSDPSQEGTEAVRCGLDSGGPAVIGPRGPLRPVTLRRHLSMALPLSESRWVSWSDHFQSPSSHSPMGSCCDPCFTPPAENRLGKQSSPPAPLSRRN